MDTDGKWYFTKEQLSNTPSRKLGIDFERELHNRQAAASFIHECGNKLQVSQLCICTATMYMHRFYMFHSFTLFQRNFLSASALFLAAKVEEQPRKLEYIIKVAHIFTYKENPPWDTKSEIYHKLVDDVLFCENLLLQTLGFECAIEHAHAFIVNSKNLIPIQKEVLKGAYFLATACLKFTLFCLQYRPRVIACMCIHLASKFLDCEIPKFGNIDWFWYIEKTMCTKALEDLSKEFMTFVNTLSSNLRYKILSLNKTIVPSPSLFVCNDLSQHNKHSAKDSVNDNSKLIKSDANKLGLHQGTKLEPTKTDFDMKRTQGSTNPVRNLETNTALYRQKLHPTQKIAQEDSNKHSTTETHVRNNERSLHGMKSGKTVQSSASSFKNDTHHKLPNMKADAMCSDYRFERHKHVDISIGSQTKPKCNQSDNVRSSKELHQNKHSTLHDATKNINQGPFCNMKNVEKTVMLSKEEKNKISDWKSIESRIDSGKMNPNFSALANNDKTDLKNYNQSYLKTHSYDRIRENEMLNHSYNDAEHKNAQKITKHVHSSHLTREISKPQTENVTKKISVADSNTIVDRKHESSASMKHSTDINKITSPVGVHFSNDSNRVTNNDDDDDDEEDDDFIVIQDVTCTEEYDKILFSPFTSHVENVSISVESQDSTETEIGITDQNKSLYINEPKNEEKHVEIKETISSEKVHTKKSKHHKKEKKKKKSKTKDREKHKSKQKKKNKDKDNYQIKGIKITIPKERITLPDQIKNIVKERPITPEEVKPAVLTDTGGLKIRINKNLITSLKRRADFIDVESDVKRAKCI